MGFYSELISSSSVDFLSKIISDLKHSSISSSKDVRKIAYNFHESFKDNALNSVILNIDENKQLSITGSGNEIASEYFEFKKEEFQIDDFKNEISLKDDVAFLIELIENSSFELGALSPADKYFEKILEGKGLNYVARLLSNIGTKCFGMKVSNYLHFLNIIKNATFMMSFDDLKTYAVCALSHTDCEIKDAGLSIFESFDFRNDEEVSEAISILKNVDTSHYYWLHDYKFEIIENLELEYKGL